MFNSLNTLARLVKIRYKRHYCLQRTWPKCTGTYWFKDHTFVLFEDELEFTSRYTGLLHLRFGQALVINRHFNGRMGKGYLILPLLYVRGL